MTINTDIDRRCLWHRCVVVHQRPPPCYVAWEKWCLAAYVTRDVRLAHTPDWQVGGATNSALSQRAEIIHNRFHWSFGAMGRGLVRGTWCDYVFAWTKKLGTIMLTRWLFDPPIKCVFRNQAKKYRQLTWVKFEAMCPLQPFLACLHGPWKLITHSQTIYD